MQEKCKVSEYGCYIDTKPSKKGKLEGIVTFENVGSTTIQFDDCKESGSVSETIKNLRVKIPAWFFSC